ncbi:hypothetical protein GLOIN_2v1776597 [Rhizophagus irregularis DAOM 181602=DAOM 197198]|nr:hypothetical protein GLOIN_2v1776597 [Rhizophagus irregularis DAOM 181602=DAOM 197198]
MSRKEMYTEGDLKIFEQLLIGALISKRSSLHCPLLTAIFRSYTVGGITQVKHKELTSSAKKVIHCKAKKFGKVLWKLTLDNIDQKIKSLKKSENPLHSNFIEGLSQLISTLDTFLDTSSQESESDEFYIKIYDSVHLENRHILRTTGEFQGKEWFSNIVVTPAEDQEQYNLDEGAWYGKVLLLFKFFRGFFKEPYELALAFIEAVNNLFLETYESYTGKARITGSGDAKRHVIHFHTAEARDLCAGSSHSELPDLVFHAHDPCQL